MRPSLAEARSRLEARLSKRSMRHVVAVSETADALARRYGVDPEAAALAGMLHDWCKNTSREELLAEARARDIEITDVDLDRPYLLHGPVAAALVAEEFPGLDRDIVHAVEVHTFGSTDMSDLDRVVYVADMIEPDRDYRGVRKLRKAVATKTLDELFMAAYERSMIHVVKRCRPLHPRTVGVWNSLLKAGAAR